MISVRASAVAGVAELPVLLSSSAEPVAGCCSRWSGSQGLSVLTFSHTSAMRLAELMARRPAGRARSWAPSSSRHQEAGNILSSAYLNALAEFMGMRLLADAAGAGGAGSPHAPRWPTPCARRAARPRCVFVMETEFLLKDRTSRCGGLYFMLPDAGFARPDPARGAAG